jgi:hypothetical protein
MGARERHGWVTQQVLKIEFALKSKATYLLIIDADTVLMQPHAFVNQQGVQALSISYEKHEPYLEHASRYFKIPKSKHSYVTHYQLWQTKYIRAMFPKNLLSIFDWIAIADMNHVSGLSEYHSYGAWLENQHPNKKAIVSWRNLGISKARWLEMQDKNSLNLSKYGQLNSISVHSHIK